jgi:L-alanine-DL-glutamate epimerase-like enolase superfamily enzyme
MNMIDRREFLKEALILGAATNVDAVSGVNLTANEARAALAKAASQAVLRKELIPSPVRIESIELLVAENEYFVRTRSTDGATGLAVANSQKMKVLVPLFFEHVAPYFLGKDARELENLLEGVYVWKNNYKMQGQSLWVCVAALEMSLLDLLGTVAAKPMGELLGGVIRKQVEVYWASSQRMNTPEEEVERLKAALESTKAKALKIRVGGRMSRNADARPHRTERLIPLVRKELGDGVTLYADSNGSYDVDHSLRIGRLLEECGYSFFEEPCPFDHYEETKEIADALRIPIAGGECEASLRMFIWMLEHDAVQVVQPDLFYFGGMIRSIKVARMAALTGKPCTVHISGYGLGYLYMLIFASCVENIGPFQEYKGESKIPVESDVSLKTEGGKVMIPSGNGWGITVDPQFLRQAHLLGSVK